MRGPARFCSTYPNRAALTCGVRKFDRVRENQRFAGRTDFTQPHTTLRPATPHRTGDDPDGFTHPTRLPPQKGRIEGGRSRLQRRLLTTLLVGDRHREMLAEAHSIRAGSTT